MVFPNLSRAVKLISVDDVLRIFLGAFNNDEVSGEATSGCTNVVHVINLTSSTMIAAE